MPFGCLFQHIPHSQAELYYYGLVERRVRIDGFPLVLPTDCYAEGFLREIKTDMSKRGSDCDFIRIRELYGFLR